MAVLGVHAPGAVLDGQPLDDHISDGLVVFAQRDDAPVGACAVHDGASSLWAAEDDRVPHTAAGQELEGLVSAGGNMEDIAGLGGIRCGLQALERIARAARPAAGPWDHVKLAPGRIGLNGERVAAVVVWTAPPPSGSVRVRRSS